MRTFIVSYFNNNLSQILGQVPNSNISIDMCVDAESELEAIEFTKAHILENANIGSFLCGDDILLVSETQDISNMLFNFSAKDVER